MCGAIHSGLSSAPTARAGWSRDRKVEPSISASPSSGVSSPTIMRMVVDLPEPFGPKKPVTSPSGAVNDSALTAVELEYRLVRL